PIHVGTPEQAQDLADQLGGGRMFEVEVVGPVGNTIPIADDWANIIYGTELSGQEVLPFEQQETLDYLDKLIGILESGGSWGELQAAPGGLEEPPGNWRIRYLKGAKQLRESVA